MATYVLIHGGGDVAWHWHLLAAELRSRGHDVVAPDLPYEDDAEPGCREYADTVVRVLRGRDREESERFIPAQAPPRSDRPPSTS